jgi:DnaK suppressor protein
MHTKKFLTNIKERLLAEKQDRLKRSAQKLDIDTDGDETDEVQANIQIDLYHKFAILNKHQLLLIDEALDRINKKTYGICVDCEEQIPEKRLLTSPYYVVCISCAEDREAEEKQRKGFKS